jgi:Mrp family chromosome partitioning ATPase
MSEELAVSDIELVDLATRPYLPVGIPWPARMGLALVLGLLLATAVATVLELRDKSIRAPEELERVMHMRDLGVIPNVVEAASGDSGLTRLRRRLHPRPDLNGLPHGIVADSQWPSIGAEAFRMLYSSLTFSWGEGSRTFLVTSVAPQEGKTFVAANLGATFAREGARVLLIDCDLRRPRLHKIFRIPREPGLMEMLRRHSRSLLVDHTLQEETGGLEERGPVLPSYSLFPGFERPSGDPEAASSTPLTTGASASISAANSNGADTKPAGHSAKAAKPSAGNSREVAVPTSNVRRTTIGGLDLLPCGGLPANPAEALQVGVVRSLLADMAKQYDVIILDTPPVLVSADAPILAPAVDDVILIVRAGQTKREAAERAYQQLAAAGASLLGVVLNDPAGVVTRYRKLYYSYDSPAVAD